MMNWTRRGTELFRINGFNDFSKVPNGIYSVKPVRFSGNKKAKDYEQKQEGCNNTLGNTIPEFWSE